MKSRKAFQPTLEQVESRELLSGQIAGSYFTGTDRTGPGLNAQINYGAGGWIYNNGVLLQGTYGVHGTLTYQGGTNYSGTLSINNTAAKFTVNGPVGNGLMQWHGTAGFINGASGTLAMSFPVIPNVVSVYTINLDDPPHRPLPKFLGGHKPVVHHVAHR